jgi:predicted lysophospholipase L1 biosynthesis ABC-type transport system permease subunit
MRSPVLPLTVSRMSAYRLVLAAAAVSILITAALVAALASFSGQALSQAVHSQLATAPGTSIAVSGQADGGQAASDTAHIRSAMRSAFGAHGFALYQSQWSYPLKLPGSYPGGGTPITQAAALPGIAAHAALVSGSWPGAARRGQPIPAALPANAAALLHVSVGGVLRVRQQVSGQSAQVRVTGLFRPDLTGDHASVFWQLDLISPSGVSRADGFSTFGPFVVTPAALRSSLGVSDGAWVVAPVTGNIQDGGLAALAAKISADQQSLSAGGLRVSTGLPALLRGIASNLLVARSLLVVAAILLLLLAAVALTSVARLLATDREGESALLTSRGGSRWQLTRLTVPEVTLLAVVSAVAGGLAGGWLASWLAHTGPLRPAGLRLHVLSWDMGGAIVVTAVFAVLILLGPVLRTVMPGAARVRRGRQAAIAGLARSGADLALVVLAGLAVWQLRHSLIVAPSANGSNGINPVMALAPALAVAAGTVILMRLLPLAAKGGDRLATRGSRLPLSLASWQISRQPVRQASVALLVVMAVATGTLALSEHQSWTRSAHDQAAFTTGADVRVDTQGGVTSAQAGAIATAPGVRQAMAAAPVTSGTTEVLALDAGQAASVIQIRRDQTPLAAPALFRAITPAGPPSGVALPGHPTGLSLVASLGAGSLRLAPDSVTVTVADAQGLVSQYAAGTLAADGRPHALSVALGSARLPAAAYPLRMTAVTVDYTMPFSRDGDGVFRLLRVGEAATTWSAPGTALRGWAYSDSSGQLQGILSTTGGLVSRSAEPAAASWRPAAGGAQQLSFETGYGLAVTPTLTGQVTFPIGAQITLTAKRPSEGALPAIVTKSFASANDVGVGLVAQADVNGITVPVRVVAVVAAFPTIPAGSGAIVVDLATVQDYLASESQTPLPVTQWWLATGRAGAALGGRLPAGSAVTTSAAVVSGLLGDALSAVPQQALLATAIAAALLAITGFCVSVAANVSQRRAQSALLSALGVASGAQARQLCLEELMLSLPSAAVGLGLGVFVSTLFVPATTLTTNATKPFPPVVTEIPWGLAIPLALAVAALPVLAAALSAARRPDPAGTLRTAESV